MHIHTLRETRATPEADIRAFTEAMSRTAAGVCIVTTNGPHGRFGLTVSSMTSVSAEPPKLLVCVNRSSVAHDAIRENGRFAINALAAHQQQIASTFAGRSPSGRHYEFNSGDWAALSGLPRLLDASAFFDCKLLSALESGSHTIFVGSVETASAGDDPALLYSERNYGYAARLGRKACPTGTDSVLERTLQ